MAPAVQPLSQRHTYPSPLLHGPLPAARSLATAPTAVITSPPPQQRAVGGLGGLGQGLGDQQGLGGGVQPAGHLTLGAAAPLTHYMGLVTRPDPQAGGSELRAEGAQQPHRVSRHKGGMLHRDPGRGGQQQPNISGQQQGGCQQGGCQQGGQQQGGQQQGLRGRQLAEGQQSGRAGHSAPDPAPAADHTASLALMTAIKSSRSWQQLAHTLQPHWPHSLRPLLQPGPSPSLTPPGPPPPPSPLSLPPTALPTQAAGPPPSAQAVTQPWLAAVAPHQLVGTAEQLPGSCLHLPPPLTTPPSPPAVARCLA
ncbi:hypothetical protein V8C86DRAFT_3150890 [Haematococcus lacustris]